MRGGAESGLGDAAQNANWVARVEAQIADQRAQEAAEASANFMAQFRSPSRRHGS